MSITKKLQSLNLANDSFVTLTYSDGTDVFVHNDTAVETAISDTDVINQFASLVATPGLKAEVPYVGPVLEAMRNDGFLEDYERGSFAFEDYISEVLTENFYDQEFIDKSIKQFDYKRGFCTLSATVKIPVEDLIIESPYTGGWTVSVPTENGTITLN